MIATIVVFRAPTPPVETEFQAVHIAVLPPPPQPPSAGDAARTAAEIQPILIPPTTPLHVINSVQNINFQVNVTKVMEQALSHLDVPPPQSTGMTQGGGNLNSGLGTSGNVNFFGVQAAGKRIAFLLDYSGSMEGAFRKTMEKQLEASLSKLPEGTQVILICWAGPAWLYNQTAPQIAKKWKKIDNYDNFTTVPGVMIDPPKWIDINAGSVTEIMKDIKAQVAALGGTDWRQPFRYAMQADPPPDVIFFLTDGQIPAATTDRDLTAISTAMDKAGTAPQVNCLWIENPKEKGNAMERLAARYKGEFRRVSDKTANQ